METNCLIAGCFATKDAKYILCYKHWTALPSNMRRKVRLLINMQALTYAHMLECVALLNKVEGESFK